MLKLFFLTLCATHLSSAQQYQYQQYSQVDDTPGGNLTLTFDPYPGPCFIIPGYLIPYDTRLYEGRWFAAEVGFTENQARNLACTVWDTYFDNEGVAHNFIHTFERGVYRRLNTQLTPLRDVPGVYELDAGMNNNDRIFTTFYYVDEEMFVFWEVTCREGNKSHYRNIVVGYRCLSLVERKAEQLERVLDKLRREGGIAQTTPIYHGHDCQYPTRTTNPYRY